MSENKYKYCMHCGTKLESDWLFCRECGIKLEKVTDVIVEENHVIANDIEFDEIQDSVEEIVEDTEELSEETDNIDTETELEVVEEMIYNHNRDHLVDLYNGIARRNSMTLFNIFLPLFIVMVISFFDSWFITGVISIIMVFMSFIIIFGNKSYKQTVDLLSIGTSKLKIEEDYFEIEEKMESIYEHSFVKYDEVLAIEENDDIIVLTTKMSRVYTIEKSILKDKLSFFRNSILKYAKNYNGHIIKKDDLSKGRYDYYPETKKTISVVRAKEKSATANIITLFSFIALFILGFVINYLFVVLLFIPIGIIELIYISKLNKKIQNNLKIVGEKVMAIILTAFAGVIGLISLLVFIA